MVGYLRLFAPWRCLIRWSWNHLESGFHRTYYIVQSSCPGRSMYGHHIHITEYLVWINRVRLPTILLVVSWTGMMNIPLSPYVPENLVSRDGFSRSVPRQPAYSPYSAESGAYSRDSSRFSRRGPFIFFNRHTPVGQCRVYRVTQLRANGVHCRESAGTGPVVLKVVPVTGAAILQVT